MKENVLTSPSVNNMSDFFAELNSSFWILEEYYLSFCTIHNLTATDMTTFRFNLHY